jgi:hypothetical protein
MVDYQRLGPWERTVLKRLMFVWTWIRGGTRYPFRFALDHPIRSAGLAYIAAGEPGAPDRLQVNKPVNEYLAEGMPPWLEGAIDVGGGKVLPTRNISPVSTPWEIAQTIRDRPGARTPFEMANPLIRAGVDVLSDQTRYGQEVGRLEALRQAGEGLEPPLERTVREAAQGSGSALYPDDATWYGRLARSSRVVPIRVDAEEAYNARVRAGMESHTAQFRHESHDAGLGDPPAKVMQELRFESELNHEVRKKEKDWGHLAGLVAGMYDTLYPGSGVAQAAHGLRNEAEAEAFYHKLRGALFSDLHEWRRRIDAVHEERLAATN